MARTKKTARKEGSGPNLASMAAGQGKGKRSRKGKPMHLFKQKTRRVNSNINALREIRKAQKVTTLCILKAPFRRLVREVSDSCKDNLKWYTTALDCLQFAAEDYLIEFFIDAVLLAAHALRKTLMLKDSNTLNMLRHRMNMLMHPVDFVDPRMRDILLIPPARRPKDNLIIQEIKEEDIHDRYTRANAHKKEILEKQGALLKRKRIETQTEKMKKGRVELEQENFDEREERINSALERFRPLGKVVMKEESGQYVRDLPDKDIHILINPIKEVSDNILYIALRYVSPTLTECMGNIVMEAM